jgi:DUF971 family protein
MTSAAAAKTPWPVELRIRQTAAMVEIDFDDGASFALPAEYLRVESPSAEVQGHGSGGKKIIAGKRKVRVTAAQPVGHYAVRLVFDDGHNTGLFTWAYLRKLGVEQDHLWAEYLTQLQRLGLSRD